MNPPTTKISLPTRVAVTSPRASGSCAPFFQFAVEPATAGDTIRAASSADGATHATHGTSRAIPDRNRRQGRTCSNPHAGRAARLTSMDAAGCEFLRSDSSRCVDAEGGTRVNHYDLIVLGSGSAARDAAAKAVQQCDASVALVESTRWGGSCPNVACKPTKAYLVVAELFHDMNHLAGKLGIDVGPASLDLARVKARKDTLKKGDAKWMQDLAGRRVRHLPGRGRAARAGLRPCRRRGAERGPDPDRDRLADRGAADRRHRRHRLDRPRLRAGADRAPGVAARRRRRAGRARVRADLRAVRLARDDRPGRRPHLSALRRAGLRGAARGARGGRRHRDRALVDRFERAARRRRGRGRRSARGRSGSPSCCWPPGGRRTSRRCGWTSSESSTTGRASSSTS